MWTQTPCLGTLSLTPPSGPDVGFYRGNFCGKRVAALPWLPGMGGNPSTGPTLCMDLDIAKYGPTNTDAQDAFFDQSVADGYTHLQVSLGDFAQQGWSIDQVVAYARRWKAHGGFVDVWVLGGAGGWGGWGIRDSMWAQNAALVTPWVETFIAAGAIDWVCLGWQLDGWLGGTPLVDNVIGLGNLIAGRIPYYSAHWINLANANWDDGTATRYGIDNRFSFWAFMAANGYLNRTMTQYDVNAPISAPGSAGGAQGSLRDIVRSLRPGQRCIPYEYAAQDQFDNPLVRPEWSGNMRGYLALCASSELGGFGNGCAYPNGMEM